MYEHQVCTIDQATWEKTKLLGKPYIKLTVELAEPITIDNIEYTRVFQALSLISWKPWGLSPLEQLKVATGIEITLDPEKGLTEGQEIPELIGKTLTLALSETSYQGKQYLRVREIYPPPVPKGELK